MNEQHLTTLQNQIEEREKILATRAEAILTLVQLQNKDRIEQQRLIELLKELQEKMELEERSAF